MSGVTGKELIASVPYALGKSIDYYDDRVVFNRQEAMYSDITGYGYSLSTFRQSIYFIPTYNSKSVTLSLSVGDDKRPIVFSKKVGMPSWFKSKEQADLDIIFSEIIKITDAFLASRVLSRLYGRIQDGGSVIIGGLIIEKHSIRKKGVFKEIELDQYGRTYISTGQVVVEAENGKGFLSMPLSSINAPLLGSLLEKLFGEQTNDVSE